MQLLHKLRTRWAQNCKVTRQVKVMSGCFEGFKMNLSIVQLLVHAFASSSIMMNLLMPGFYGTVGYGPWKECRVHYSSRNRNRTKFFSE